MNIKANDLPVIQFVRAFPRLPRPQFMAALTAIFVLVILVDPTTTFAQKGKGGGGPKYELVQLQTPGGFSGALASDLNDAHRVIGNANPRANSERGVYWDFPDAAAQVELLPCPSYPCRSRANGINGAGVIVGYAAGTAARWTRSGAGWELAAFPHPGDDTYFAEAFDILDDGTAAGSYGYEDEQGVARLTPVIWDPAGYITELPIPGGFFAAEAKRVNSSGDAVGEFRSFYSGNACCFIYGAIWMNTGSGYLVVALNDLVTGITTRTGDGSFYVSSQAGRLRISEADGELSVSYETGPGPANAINEGGDIAGNIPRGYSLGQPYLLFFSGTLVKLPVTKGGSGAGYAVSTDRYVAGVLENSAVVWRPLN